MIKKVFYLFIIFNFSIINAQDKFILFPSDLNIMPFTANFLEPKIGFLFQTGGNKIRLEIGNSSDVVHYNLNSNTILSGGVDFFTYTYLYGEKDFHFPVDAVDYLFGINFGYKKKEVNNEYGFRFRFSHISAHFVDGHRDNINNKWKNDINPIVYSREFFELLPFYKFNNFRTYLGMTYLYHVDPKNIGKEIYQIGFDYFAKDLLGNYITPFVAYDFKLQKIGEYRANNAFSIGVKLGNTFGRGFSLYYHYYNGKNIHGEYYFMDENFSSIGFNLDL